VKRVERAEPPECEEAELNDIALVPQPLTAEAFARFGDVIEKKGADSQEINAGTTQKYSDLAVFDTSDEAGRTALHLYHSRTIPLPLRIEILECHPLGSQAFIPLHQRPFLIVVAPAGAAPNSADVRAFYSNGQQGVNYRKGVWHHYLINLYEPGDYLIIDRMGPGQNYAEHRLAQALMVEKLPGTN
jgi:ureidoglycolate lyase